MIWYSTKELFFDLLIGVKVKSDDKCYCTAIETIKPLWLDDLLWDLLKMETNKKEPLSYKIEKKLFYCFPIFILKNKWVFKKLEKIERKIKSVLFYK